MTSHDETQRFRTIERRHMIRVKDALAFGVERLGAGTTVDESDARGFVVACVDYLEFIVGRFVGQGRGNTERLRAAIPASDAASLGIVDDIEHTLAATRERLDALVAARGADAADLADAAHEFLDFYASTLARRKDPAQAIVDRYIDPDTYWRATNDVTAESVETERRLFHRLTELAPDIVQPDPG